MRRATVTKIAAITAVLGLVCFVGHDGSSGFPVLSRLPLFSGLAGVSVSSLISGFSGTGASLLGGDFQEAQAAARDGEWTRAQRYLERYLRTEEDPDQRWAAWTLLMDVSLRSDPSGTWTVDYLETMLLEYADAPNRTRDTLRRLAGIHESARRFSGAVAAWEQYCLLPGLDDDENALIQRRLARLYMQQRRFDEAEAALRICVALSEEEAQQAECLFELANLAGMREDAAAASELARTVLNVGTADPATRARAGFILADILEEQGKQADALELFKTIRPDYPNELVVDYRIQALGKKK